MKYSAITLLFCGLISQAEASTSLTQNQGQLHSVAIVDQEEDSDDDTLVMWTSEFGGAPDGIIDALTAPEGSCEDRLWMSQAELDWQVDMFSRTFDKKYYENAMKISGKMKFNTPKFHAWELLNNAFSFPRVRKYEMVEQNMNLLEHFQDNFNLNKSNRVNMENFARVGKTVLAAFNEKYHDGEFDSPALHDPREDALNKYNAGKA